MINKKSPIPLYYQLQEHIKELIEKGELKPGDTIPPEREYSQKFQISRMTARQALSHLVNDGYLHRIQGKGTFVSERKIVQPLHQLRSFSEDMIARGLTPGSQLISFEIIPATSQIASQLDIQEYGPVYEIKRIRLADDLPMAFESSYIPANRVKGLTEQIVKKSVYLFMEEHLNFRIDHASQEIESSIANQIEAKFLKIKKGSPIMLIQQTTFLQDETPVEFVKSSYRADRYKFIIQMKR